MFIHSAQIRRSRARSVLVTVTLAAMLSTLVAPMQPATAVATSDAATEPGVDQVTGAAPFGIGVGYFEPNVGQAAADVRFLGHGTGGRVLLTGSGAVTQLRDGEQTATVTWQLADADPTATVVGERDLTSSSNYLRGEQDAWLTDVPHHRQVRYRQIRPGVDLVWRADGDGRLAYDLELEAGVDPSELRVSFDGGDRLELADNGDLLVHTEAGILRQSAPVTYQPQDGRRRAVASRFLIDGDSVGFAIDGHDPSLPLVIDPTLLSDYGTFLGGYRNEYGRAVTVDESGDTPKVAVLLGYHDHPGLEGRGDLHEADGDGDWFSATGSSYRSLVAEFDPTASGDASLVSLTYFGESDGEILYDGAGRLHYITQTRSTDFPTTASAYDGTGHFSGYSPEPDLGYLVLDPRLSGTDQLIYGTYLGGGGYERVTWRSRGGLAVDASGRAYITGDTDSADLPTKGAGADTAIAGGTDVFVAVLDPSASGEESLAYASYLGGSGDEEYGDIAVAPDGGIWVGLATGSTDMPVGTDDFQPASAGGVDLYLAKLDPGAAAPGSAITYGSYLGGDGDEDGSYLAIDVDGTGVVHLAGRVPSGTSTTVPLRGAYDESGRGYVAVLDPTAVGDAQLRYATRIAFDAPYDGSPSSSLFDLSLDASGRMHLVGTTRAGAAWEGGHVLVLDPTKTGADAIVSEVLVGEYSAPYRITVDRHGRSYATGAHWGTPEQFALLTDTAYDATGDSGRDLILAVLSMAPSWPDSATLTAESRGADHVTMAWSAADDDAAVTGYRLHDVTGSPDCTGGVEVARTDGATLRAQVTGLSPETTYAFRVDAGDAVGNWTSGPCEQVTTGSEGSTEPGTAALTATARSDGSVDLLWDPSGAADLTGYRIHRAIAGGSEQAIAEVDAATTTYADPDLPADTEITYRVTTLHTDGSERSHTVPATVTTASLGDVRVEWSAPRDGFGPLRRAGTLRISAEAQPGRRASADVEVSTWYGTDGSTLTDGPRRDTVAVELVEDADQPGVYVGELDLDGVAELLAITANVDDGDGTRTTGRATGLPVEVAGGLEVTVDAPLEAMPESQLHLRHPTQGTGGVAAIADPNPTMLDDIAQAADYELRVVDRDGRVLGSASDVVVDGGIVRQVTVQPQVPAQLEVTVADGDTVFPGASVVVREPATGDVIATLTTDETGTTPQVAGRFQHDEVEVSVELPDDVHYVQELADPATLSDPLLNRATLSPTPLRAGTVTGTVVTDVNRVAVPGTGVRLTQTVDGRSWTWETETDESGDFAITAFHGGGELTIMAPRASADSYDVTVPEDVGELTVSAPFDATVDVELYTRYAGEGWHGPLGLDWSSAIHYQIRARTASERLRPREFPFSARVADSEATVEVCADGRQAGLPSQCSEVVVGDDGRATVELRLDQAARLEGQLQRPDGEAYRGSWSTQVHEVVAGDRVQLIGTVEGAGPDLVVPVPAAGTYDVFVTTPERGSTVERVRVADGAIGDLGAVTLQRDGPVAGAPGTRIAPGNSELVVGGVVRLDATVHNSATDRTLAGRELAVRVPAGARVLPDATTVDGQPANVTDGGGTITVGLGDLAPDDRRNVQVAFQLESRDPQGRLGTYARVQGGDGPVELLGAVILAEGNVSVRARAVTTDRSVTLTGTAPAGATVAVDDGGVPLGTAVAEPTGRWRLDATVPDRGVPAVHRLRATSGDASAETLVHHDPTYPQLDTIAMGQPANGRTEIQLDGSTAQFPFVFRPDQPLHVEAQFTNAEQVRDPKLHIGDDVTVPMTPMADGSGFEAVTDLDWSQLGPVDVSFDAARNVQAYPWWPEVPERVARARLAPSWQEFEVTSSEEGGDPDAAITEVSAGSEGTGAEATDLAGMLMRVAATGTDETHTMSGTAGNSRWRTVVRVRSTEYTPTESDVAFTEETGIDVYGLQHSGSAGDTSASARLSGYVPTEAVREDDGATASAAAFGAAFAADIEPLGLAFGGPTSRPGHDATGAGRVRTAANKAEVLLISISVGFKANDAVGAGDKLLSELTGSGMADTIAGLLAAAAECQGPAGPGLQAAAENLRRNFIIAETTKLGLAAAGAVLSPTLVGGVLMAAGSFLVGMAADDVIADQTADLQSKIADAFNRGRCNEGDEEPPKEDDEDDDEEEEDEQDDREVEPSDRDPGECFYYDWIHYEVDGETKRMPIRKPVPCDDGPGGPPGGGGGVDPRWILDPSGIVYEAVPSNVVEGATATALFAEEPEGPWTVWDAEWYGQVNPHDTDARGRYGWDVPFGFWKVRVEADGYEPTESGVLEVPPPHTEVDLGLRDLSPPEVTGLAVTGDTTAVVVRFDRHMLASTLHEPTVHLIDGNGRPVPGTVDHPSEVEDPEGRLLSTDVRFTPEPGLRLGESYSVRIDPAAESYAERPLGLPFERGFTVEENRAPTAGDDAFTVGEDGLLVADGSEVLGNDTDDDGHLIEAAVTQEPSHGTLEFGSDGSFTYRPDADFVGTDEFAYVAEDGWESSDPATVTIAVTGRNDRPRAIEDGYELSGGRIVRGGADVLANDVDPDGDRLRARVVAPPRHGTLEFAGDGEFSYRAGDTFSGEDAFSYVLWDGALSSAPVDVVLTETDRGSSQGPPDDSRDGASGEFGSACPDGAPDGDRFADVPADNVHHEAVRCLASWGLVEGVGDARYDPAGTTTRAQVASLLQRVLEEADVPLPSDPEDAFSDDAGSIHEGAIDQLAALGVVHGIGDGRYVPGAFVTRGQFASLLARVHEIIAQERLPQGPDAFVDDDRSVHEPAIDRLAAADLIDGITVERFGPARSLRRDQTASFLARLVDRLVAAGHLGGERPGSGASTAHHRTAADRRRGRVMMV